ncbi:DUF4132 domain-containing protein [Streptomyces sp. V2I9]|uniref:DUF4132 domain-containing protein n=1 Tax=Streptomyces sp. V2I9 TaxID=3042304 RepID=UPI002788D52C|nr:DUF4132 domain-containing protein [Streptomyces sp. V2I9]MDQ0988708.1 hypothetical protein [Streptomyces sp. V2I9]
MGWLAAGDTYEIALREGRVVARSAADRRPSSLPEEIRDDPAVIGLQRFAEWMEWHAAGCVKQVETWMVSSLPVPTALLAQVWPDEAWRNTLRDLVVVGGDPEETGFLRGVERTGDAGGLPLVVTTGGDTLRISSPTVALPHPVLLPQLEELRSHAAEFGVSQRVEQLHRPTWRKPEAADALADEAATFAGAYYASWYRLAGRATALGHKVGGDHATVRVQEAGRTLTAAVHIGNAYNNADGATAGEVVWSDPHGSPLPLTDVGPIAWSEGMRMAAALHAGRTVTADHPAG